MRRFIELCFGFFFAAGGWSCVGDAPAGPMDGSMPGTDTGMMTDSGAGSDSPAMTCDGGLICSNVCTPVMTDPTNCGRCGHDCGMGAKCMDGQCGAVLVTSNATGAVALATESAPDNPMGVAQHVFWAVPNAGVFQENAVGGNKITLSTSALSQNDVAVHGANVFWPTYFGGNSAIIIYRGNVGTAMSQINVGTFMAGVQNSVILDPGGTKLFGSYTSSPNFGVYKCGLNMTACTVQASFAGKPGINIATDGTSVFTADQNGGGIIAVSMANPGSTSIITGQATPNLLRVDGTHLYWSNSGTKTIWRADLTGGNKMQIATTTAAADGLAADAVYVYWTEAASGTLKYAPIGGGGSTTPYVTQGASSSPMRLVRDGNSLFWIQNTSIYRVALP